MEEGLDWVVRSRCGRHWEDIVSVGEIGYEVVWWAGTLWKGGVVLVLIFLFDSAVAVVARMMVAA
jgi:hypothetical protein